MWLRDRAVLRHGVIQGASARDKPIVLTGLAVILNGMVISLIFGISVSTLRAIAEKPVLYYATLYKKFQ
jgi:multidrug efflux pump subunit AcrB